MIVGLGRAADDTVIIVGLILPMVVVADEVTDLLFGIAGEIVVREQDAVLECLVPAFRLALRLCIQRRSAYMVHDLRHAPARLVLIV